jgi:probable O-glycosylation ligase (exosortase A-associated)
MSAHAASREWWRPDTAPTPAATAVVAAPSGNTIAFAALIAFTTILLVSPQAWFPAIKSLRIALLAGIVAIAAHFASRMFGQTAALPLRREMVVALAFIVWAAITIPLSIWPGGSWAQLTDHLIKAVIFFWLIGTLVTTRQRLERFMWVLALCAIPLAATALANYQSGVFITHATSSVQRIAGYVGGAGLAGNPNDLALMLNLLLPLTGALFIISRQPWLRLVALAALMLSVAAVIATFSRAGFITLAVISLSALAAAVRRGALGAAVVVAFLAIGAFVVIPEQYFNRLSTITNIDADTTGSAQGRWEDYFVSLEYIRMNPLTGAGLGQDLLALNETRGHATWRSVHNAYLQAAVDLGIPGVALLLALLLASFANARRVRRHAARRKDLRDLEVMASGIHVSLVAFTVAAFFHPIAYQFYFFCLAGLAVALVNAHRAALGSRVGSAS